MSDAPVIRIQDELDALRREVQLLRAELRASESSDFNQASAEGTVDEVHSRRHVITRGAIALGAAAAIGGITTKPAAAVDGDAVLVGGAFTGTAETSITSTVVGGSTLDIVNNADTGSSFAFHAIGKAAAEPAVYGVNESSGAGIGVRGDGQGNGGTGVTGLGGIDGIGVSGSASGSGSGLAGFNVSTVGGGEGVLGRSTAPFGAGVVGVADHVDSGVGVAGDSSGALGVGVDGRTDVGIGVQAVATGDGLGASFAGGLAAFRINSSGVSPGMDALFHNPGEVRSDNNGDLWWCVVEGTPGVWRKLSGFSASGATHVIDPTRVYDSRFVDGPLAGAANRVISVANGIDVSTGATTVFDLVPPGATSVAFNLAIVFPTAAPGFLSVTPGDAATFSAAAVNWAATGALLNNGTQSALDVDRQLKVFSSASTDFVIDITSFTI